MNDRKAVLRRGLAGGGVPIALLAVSLAAISVASLHRSDGVTGLGPLEGLLTAGLVGYFAWFVRECWVGGSVIETETFVVD